MTRREIHQGDTFGLLTVLGYDHSEGYVKFYKCQCSCDAKTICVIRGASLTKKKNPTRSCGCLQKKAMKAVGEKKRGKVDMSIIGKKYGRLEVLEFLRMEGKESIWKCVCKNDGNIVEVKRSYLTGKITQSCGCLAREREQNQAVDLSKYTYGKLHPISYFRKGNRTFWHCHCDCDKDLPEEERKVVDVWAYALISGKTTSCGCKTVNHSGSKQEHEIIDFLKDVNSSVNIIEHNKSLLSGKEIDIYLPEYEFGIEFNGSSFHASVNNVYVNKDKFYHRDKFLLAKERGLHLVNIFDVDWENNKDKIKEFLKSAITTSIRIFARNCVVKSIDSDIACEFYDKYHLQGAPQKWIIEYDYGLFDKDTDELYSVMSFGKLRMSKTDVGCFELHRYCTKFGYTVVGGANKLHKAFEREVAPIYIRSYSDNDFFSGNIYSRLGYSNAGQSTPRYYWYFGGKEIRREKCKLRCLAVKYPELLQEAYDVKADNKEDYVMSQLGAQKIWRSGTTKWEWRKNFEEIP